MKVNEFVSILFHSRSQAHIFHLKTKSFSQHKALDNYYQSIIPLTDKFIESYQGKYSTIGQYYSLPFIENTNEILTYFDNLLLSISKFKVKDSYLNNIIDSIYELIYSTLYNLTLK